MSKLTELEQELLIKLSNLIKLTGTNNITQTENWIKKIRKRKASKLRTQKGSK